MRVSPRSQPSSVAGNIAKLIREHHYAELQSEDAAAVNQCIKAIVLARSDLQKEGIEIAFRPCFVDVQRDRGRIRAIRLIIEPRK